MTIFFFTSTESRYRARLSESDGSRNSVVVLTVSRCTLSCPEERTGTRAEKAAAAAFILSKKEQEKEYRDLCEKGNRYLEQMDYQQAADSYLAAIEIEPQEPELYIGLADAYTGLEDMEQARENYRKAIKLDAGRPDAYMGLVNSYIGDNPNPSYEDPDDTVSEIISEAQENVAEEDRESFDELEFWYEDYERYLA